MRASSDDRRATQNSCIAVNGHSIFQSRMSFGASNQVAVVIPWKRPGTQSDALVQCDVGTNLTGFTNHNSRAMINKERLSDS